MPSELLRLSNFDQVNISARTTLGETAQSGQSTITLENAAGFADEQFLVLSPATENAELVQVDSLSGSTVTLKAPLGRLHQPGALVVQLFGDQLAVYRAPDADGTQPDDNTFTSLTPTVPTNPVTLQADQNYTTVTDPNGGKDYWYKAVYRNSVTATTTDISLALAVRGGDYGHYAPLEDIREEAGFAYFSNVTDVQVSLARDKAEAEINAVCASVGYTLPIEVSVPLLTSITLMLAAGHLLKRSYGAGAEGTTKDGDALLKQGRDLLTRLSTGLLQLVDEAGNVLPNTTNSMEDGNAWAECSTSEPIFRKGDIY